jgi:predicted RNA-binding protein with PIN domain
MGLVRILVDGYSLLHAWPGLCKGQAPHSAAAREGLIYKMTLYQDATGIAITIVFDGADRGRGTRVAHLKNSVEVLYSKAGQTADQVIERAAHRFRPYGEVLAVTDDVAERETVLSLGGLASSCGNFVETVENTLAEQADDIKLHNRKERHRFQRREG